MMYTSAIKTRTRTRTRKNLFLKSKKWLIEQIIIEQNTLTGLDEKIGLSKRFVEKYKYKHNSGYIFIL